MNNSLQLANHFQIGSISNLPHNCLKDCDAYGHQLFSCSLGHSLGNDSSITRKNHMIASCSSK